MAHVGDLVPLLGSILPSQHRKGGYAVTGMVDMNFAPRATAGPLASRGATFFPERKPVLASFAAQSRPRNAINSYLAVEGNAKYRKHGL